MKLEMPILATKWTSPKEFVSFWSEHYDDPNEQLYFENIGKPLTPQRVQDLFYWKNGGPLSKLKHLSVEKNYISRLDELQALSLDATAMDFLAIFSTGGAIWRIFWLHCWQPDRFPIYDMHVHRAMSFIETGNCEEISQKPDKWKIDVYLNRYLTFCSHFSALKIQISDRALWTFGKYIKNNPIMGNRKSS